MATPYRPISWGNEYISADKLNIMTSNDQYLFERMPSIYYNGPTGIKRSSGGLKILAGCAVIQKNLKRESAIKDFHFGSYFSQGCRPVITTGMTADTPGRYSVMMTGFGQDRPDNRGVRFKVFSNTWKGKGPKIYRRIYVYFIAVGY